MRYTAFHQYRVSQLALGTIQLGMDYGIANTAGAPDREEAFHILDKARESGITAFDTARTYGKAEKVLGDYFSGASSQADLVVTKFKYNWEPGLSIEKAWDEVKAGTLRSLRDLQTDRISLSLYHKGGQEPMEEVMRIVPVLVNRLRENGYIAHGGISLYYPDDAPYLDNDLTFEAIQVPLNVLDQKIIHDGTLKRLHDKGKLVFIRSVFLQGLFFRNPRELTGVLSRAVPYLDQIRLLADRYGLTIAELAFGFIRDLPEVDSLVIGAENEAQIFSNLSLLNGPELPGTLRADLRSLAESVPTEVITPGLWQT